MTKQQTKMELVTTEESTSYKKARMLEIRSIVRKAIAQNQRIDLMDFHGTDVARVIVALQDEVTNSQTRHRKASKFIAENKDQTGFVIMLLTEAMEIQNQVVQQLMLENYQQQQLIQKMQDSNSHLAEQLYDARAAVRELRR